MKLILLLGCVTAVYAACTGSSPTWTAASASQSDVQACITAVGSSGADGDTINVPAGSATWASNVALSATKGINLIGAGSASTLITCTGQCITGHTNVNFRISGISFTYSGATQQEMMAFGANDDPTGKVFRIDNNIINSPNAWATVDIWGGGASCSIATHASGLFDHNIWTNASVHVNGTNCIFSDGPAQHYLWAQAPPKGSWPGMVYLETNTFNCTGSPPAVNVFDGNYGARMIFRFNTINNTGTGTCYLEFHGVQGANRAAQWWEIYKNTLVSATNGFFGLGFFRGGSGVVWGNTVPTSEQSMKLNDQRSNVSCVTDTDCATSGPCDGTSTWDQKTSGLNGYACRDQIGRSQDAVQWVVGAAYTEALTPAYFWSNLAGAAQYVPALHDSGSGTSYLSVHVVEDKDWYTQNVSFDGTSGVGVGALASRPSTCTTGVGYWATDQGNWNQSGSGGQGVLYRCIAADTWSLYYTPFTYPHPLQGTSGVPPLPAAPTGLVLTVK